MDHIVSALACFVRTLVSGDSPFDRYTQALDDTALTASQKRGLDLFFSEKAECFHCHSGFNFSGASAHGAGVLEGSWFFNIGLYDVDGEGGYPPPNTGVFGWSGVASDMGRFRVPSLRNVALTGPYMHDGSVATLEDVVRHYEAGGRNVESGPNAGDGRKNRWKSEFVAGFQITDQERADLVAFLESLTDTSFVQDPRFSDPEPPATPR